jgi:hypothetical protein
MPSGSRYRQYAEECLRSAQAATPVQRAHLLRVARTWFEIADQTDASEGESGDLNSTTNGKSSAHGGLDHPLRVCE